jgi:hypothetical protein
LASRYKKDAVLLGFYRRRLLQRGWAGVTDDVEKAYLAAHAPWYRVLQEQGRRLAESFPDLPTRTGQRGAKAVDGEAPPPGAEVNTTRPLF